MSYDWNENPLKNVKVENPERCSNREHVSEMIIWGTCSKCGEDIKNLFVVPS